MAKNGLIIQCIWKQTVQYYVSETEGTVPVVIMHMGSSASDHNVSKHVV